MYECSVDMIIFVYYTTCERLKKRDIVYQTTPVLTNSCIVRALMRGALQLITGEYYYSH